MVFVVDATGSMVQEIKTVSDFLIELSNVISKKHRQDSIELAAGVGNIDTTLRIHVSLIIYQDIHPRGNTVNTKLIFKKLSLPSQLETIKPHFSKLPTMLNGGTEALHDGLLTALNSDVWSENYSHRMIILIADEPGEHIQDGIKGATQNDVLQKMPLPRKKLESLRFDISKVRKQDHTKIWAIYTREGSVDFDKFKQNVSQLAFRIKDIPNFEKDSKKSIRTKMIDELYASIEDAGNVVKEKVTIISDAIRDGLDEDEDTKKLNSTTMLARAAVKLVLDKQGTTLEEIAKLSKVAFVEGYIKEQYSYHKYPTFRRRVMVEEDELVGLKAVAQEFILALQDALSRIKTQKRDIQELIGQAMLYAIATVEGDYDVMDELDDPKTRGRAINQWWKTGKTSNETIADLINAPKFLPFSKIGIFGVTREELKDWSFDDLKNQTNQSYQKVKCMELVIADKTVPNEFGTCLTYEGKTKRWAYKPPNSDSKYIYLPEWMIP
jgi:hypothetical protein